MNWIWQRPGWPDFTWSQADLEPLEARFRDDAGRRIGAWRRLGEDERIDLRVGWLSDEAAETSAIEGEFLDRDSVQSSVRRQFGLAHDRRPASPAEAGGRRDDGFGLSGVRSPSGSPDAVGLAPNADAGTAQTQRNRRLPPPRRADASGFQPRLSSDRPLRGATVRPDDHGDGPLHRLVPACERG